MFVSGRNALFCALIEERHEVMEYLLKEGCAINMVHAVDGGSLVRAQSKPRIHALQGPHIVTQGHHSITH